MPHAHALIYFLCAPGTEWCSRAHLYNSPARHQTDQFSFVSGSGDTMIGSPITNLVSTSTTINTLQLIISNLSHYQLHKGTLN
jgi:hypothetical protein